MQNRRGQRRSKECRSVLGSDDRTTHIDANRAALIRCQLRSKSTTGSPSIPHLPGLTLDSVEQISPKKLDSNVAGCGTRRLNTPQHRLNYIYIHGLHLFLDSCPLAATDDYWRVQNVSQFVGSKRLQQIHPPVSSNKGKYDSSTSGSALVPA